MTDPRLNRPLKQLLNGISTDVQLLLSQTVTLAQLEISTGCRLARCRDEQKAAARRGAKVRRKRI
jgi:hypothetical protein